MTHLSERVLRKATHTAPELAGTSPTLSAAGAGLAYLGYRAQQ